MNKLHSNDPCFNRCIVDSNIGDLIIQYGQHRAEEELIKRCKAKCSRKNYEGVLRDPGEMKKHG